MLVSCLLQWQGCKSSGINAHSCRGWLQDPTPDRAPCKVAKLQHGATAASTRTQAAYQQQAAAGPPAGPSRAANVAGTRNSVPNHAATSIGGGAAGTIPAAPLAAGLPSSRPQLNALASPFIGASNGGWGSTMLASSSSGGFASPGQPPVSQPQQLGFQLNNAILNLLPGKLGPGPLGSPAAASGPELAATSAPHSHPLLQQQQQQQQQFAQQYAQQQAGGLPGGPHPGWFAPLQVPSPALQASNAGGVSGPGSPAGSLLSLAGFLPGGKLAPAGSAGISAGAAAHGVSSPFSFMNPAAMAARASTPAFMGGATGQELQGALPISGAAAAGQYDAVPPSPGGLPAATDSQVRAGWSKEKLVALQVLAAVPTPIQCWTN